MKKIRLLIFSLLICFLGIVSVKAASFGMSTNARTVVVGNTFKVTVTVNGTGTAAGSAGAWTYCVNYDSSILALTSPASPCVNDGVVGLTSATMTFTFKAKQSGTTTISLSNAVAYDYISEAQLSTNKGSVMVTAKTQSEIIASYSTNADLSAIIVDGYELTPTFNKDVLEYSFEVENEIEKVNISATRADSRSSLKGVGEIELSEGINKVELVVTAEKGNQKTYVVNVTRKELNPINVKVDGKDYKIVRKADMLEAPPYYVSSTQMINDEEVPSFKSDISGYTLVGLKDDDGNIKLFIYDINTGTYREFRQLGLDSFVLILEEATDLVEGYDNAKVIRINDINVQTYYKDGTDEDYALVYGLNSQTGEKNWYQYDIKEGTFQRFQNKEVIKLQNDINYYLLLLVIMASGFGLALLSVIILLVSNSKVKKKNVKLMTVLESGQVVTKDCVLEEVEPDEDEEEEELNSEDETSVDDQDDDEEEVVVTPPKRRRGRPKKLVSFDDDDE